MVRLPKHLVWPTNTLFQVPKMRIRKCSHVGGHKYAGNVMVYGKDQWHWQLDLNGILRGSKLKLKSMVIGTVFPLKPVQCLGMFNEIC